jgi:hypothetical protein
MKHLLTILFILMCTPLYADAEFIRVCLTSPARDIDSNYDYVFLNLYSDNIS